MHHCTFFFTDCVIQAGVSLSLRHIHESAPNKDPARHTAGEWTNSGLSFREQSCSATLFSWFSAAAAQYGWEHPCTFLGSCWYKIVNLQTGGTKARRKKRWRGREEAQYPFWEAHSPLLLFHWKKKEKRPCSFHFFPPSLLPSGWSNPMRHNSRQSNCMFHV